MSDEQTQVLVKQRQTHQFGWVPSLPDPRDDYYTLPYHFAASSLPAEVDLRNDGFMPKPYDQGQLGSCTANGVAGMVEHLLGKEGKAEFTPSRLFIYYFERYIEGSVEYDSGAQVRDGLKVVSKYGFVNEAEWPYDIDKFTVCPPDSVVKDASRDKVLRYARVPRPVDGSLTSRIEGIQSVLAGGNTVVFGFTVYDNFQNGVGSDGVMPFPKMDSSIVGGHCVLLVGYKTIKDSLFFIVRNSWGESWGDGGYFYMPAGIVAEQSMSSDFWTATLADVWTGDVHAQII